MGLPRFLCIGAQKAGTSWLFEHLNHHPELWMPPIKELHYFDHLFVERNRRWTLAHIQTGARRVIRWHVNKTPKPDLRFIKYVAQLGTGDVFTERWYRFAFSRPTAQERVCGDVTPEYCTIPQDGVEYVRKLLGDAKIIYIIREPVSRALSQLRMAAMRRGVATEDEATWMQMAEEPDVENRGAYSDYIPRWQAAFPAKDILFIPYGRIADEPLALLRDIERFLGVGEHEFQGLDKRIHASVPIPIPDPVKSLMEAKFAPQRRFIEHEFGAEFAAQI